MKMHELLPCLRGVKEVGREQYLALCPCHDDHRPSLSVRSGIKGIIMTCPVCGANGAQVMQALGMSVRDLFYEQTDSRPESYSRPESTESSERPERPPSVDYLYSETLRKTRLYVWDEEKGAYRKSF